MTQDPQGCILSTSSLIGFIFIRHTFHVIRYMLDVLDFLKNLSYIFKYANC